MTASKSATWAYTEEFVPEPSAIEAAAARGRELGCAGVSPGTGAALRLLAGAARARVAVEIGTGAGVSGLWLLEGMPADGVLTTIDVEPAHQRAARTAFRSAGIAPQRTRVITGAALAVLPRLTDAAYDLVLVDADQREYPAYVEQAVRLLRPGGVLVVDDMLHHDRVADPAARDETTTLLRELGKTLRDDDRLAPCLLPTGQGLFAAIRR